MNNSVNFKIVNVFIFFLHYNCIITEFKFIGVELFIMKGTQLNANVAVNNFNMYYSSHYFILFTRFLLVSYWFYTLMY